MPKWNNWFLFVTCFICSYCCHNIQVHFHLEMEVVNRIVYFTVKTEYSGYNAMIVYHDSNSNAYWQCLLQW
jgi:hypothetical protein